MTITVTNRRYPRQGEPTWVARPSPSDFRAGLGCTAEPTQTRGAGLCERKTRPSPAHLEAYLFYVSAAYVKLWYTAIVTGQNGMARR